MTEQDETREDFHASCRQALAALEAGRGVGAEAALRRCGEKPRNRRAIPDLADQALDLAKRLNQFLANGDHEALWEVQDELKLYCRDVL